MITLTRTRQFIPISYKYNVSQSHQFFILVGCKDARDNFCVEFLETKYQREKQFPKDYVFHSHSTDAYEVASFEICTHIKLTNNETLKRWSDLNS